MNVIFFNVDGVLNTKDTKLKIESESGKLDIGYSSGKAKRLNKIIKNTNSYAVLIGDWSNDRKKRNLLSQKIRFVSKTNNIKQWLKDNDDISIDKWIIIDNINNKDTYSEDLLKYIIFCEEDGLTSQKAIQIEGTLDEK